MATVLLGIGSNLGDRQANIDRALEMLKAHEEIDLLAVSRVMETDPVGGPPQGNFLNAAAKIKTGLSPLDLLAQLKGVERRLGRTKGEPNAPRPMDLDILFYEDVVILEGRNLTIPHPRLASREFVLKPLAEIAPDWVHPRLKKTVRELYQAFQNQDAKVS
ncbi:MAG: 2-amino-4-hydroxy-6-hydroxymethyldihydropteridine diphosphokinase [Candidatus Omnitrophica bacterium]|nr:2-amino-4-hydroxy-6-hydroxymethyldihydropteridine diphosphokinase [Candidatus Omnitrophota bacterium]